MRSTIEDFHLWMQKFGNKRKVAGERIPAEPLSANLITASQEDPNHPARSRLSPVHEKPGSPSPEPMAR